MADSILNQYQSWGCQDLMTIQFSNRKTNTLKLSGSPPRLAGEGAWLKLFFMGLMRFMLQTMLQILRILIYFSSFLAQKPMFCVFFTFFMLRSSTNRSLII